MCKTSDLKPPQGQLETCFLEMKRYPLSTELSVNFI